MRWLIACCLFALPAEALAASPLSVLVHNYGSPDTVYSVFAPTGTFTSGERFPLFVEEPTFRVRLGDVVTHHDLSLIYQEFPAVTQASVLVEDFQRGAFFYHAEPDAIDYVIVPVTIVPEPGSMAMGLAAIAGLLLIRRVR